MIHNMYVIYDSKAGVYNKPFYLMNHEVAIRAATDLMMDGNTEIAKHPEDYAMFHVGTYDDERAYIEPFDKQDCIVRFHEIKLPLPGTCSCVLLENVLHCY